MSLADDIFQWEPRVRYVAVNQNGSIEEMTQSPAHPTYNPHETDRIEELIVNPIVLEITRRRGMLDMGGVRHVVIRYGTQYQLLIPYRDGHLSVGVELHDDPHEIAAMLCAKLGLSAEC